MTTVECPTCHRSLNDTTPRPVLPRDAQVPQVDLLELLELTRVQTPRSAARYMYSTAEPTRAETERARRRLEHLVTQGEAQRRDGRTGGPNGGTETRYVPTADARPGDV
jgi:hypothetical protein